VRSGRQWLGERETEPDGQGPGVSGERIPFREFSRVGCGLDPELGRMAPLRPFILFLNSFSFSIFPFLICFLYFAKMLQIQSNKFLSYSNIPSNVLK
jgi:hypothetical protein